MSFLLKISQVMFYHGVGLDKKKETEGQTPSNFVEKRPQWGRVNGEKKLIRQQKEWGGRENKRRKSYCPGLLRQYSQGRALGGGGKPFEGKEGEGKEV